MSSKYDVRFCVVTANALWEWKEKAVLNTFLHLLTTTGELQMCIA